MSCADVGGAEAQASFKICNARRVWHPRIANVEEFCEHAAK
jgi:hypothetical protein